MIQEIVKATVLFLSITSIYMLITCEAFPNYNTSINQYKFRKISLTTSTISVTLLVIYGLLRVFYGF